MVINVLVQGESAGVGTEKLTYITQNILPNDVSVRRLFHASAAKRVDISDNLY